MSGPILRVVAAALTASAVGIAEAEDLPGDADWTLSPPTDGGIVALRGEVSYDKAGINSGGLLYPAPDPITLLASIAVHGLVSSSMRDSQKSKMQTEADKVLVPYEAITSHWVLRDMESRALSLGGSGAHGHIGGAAPADGTWMIQAQPQYVLTQDQRALILENTLALYAPGQHAGKPAYANRVRVVSAPREETSIKEQWIAQDGEPLHLEGARLFAVSLDAFVADARRASQHADAPVFHTVRYPSGGTEQMERAQVVDESCHRVTLKTLRGWLLSVPSETAVLRCEETDTPAEAIVHVAGDAGAPPVPVATASSTGGAAATAPLLPAAVVPSATVAAPVAAATLKP